MMKIALLSSGTPPTNGAIIVAPRAMRGGFPVQDYLGLQQRMYRILL